MKAQIRNFRVDFSKPLDISIPITNDGNNPIAWYIDEPKIEPQVFDNWVGRVSEGSSTNFNNIYFNPHGHGTHTECVGHITREFYSVNKCLTQFFFLAELLTIAPEERDGDLVISKKQLMLALEKSNSQDHFENTEALIIRTLPNSKSKKSRNYSNTNPPYLTEDAANFCKKSGIKHLLVDLPSVDKEKDEGKLLAHKAFWNVTDVENLNADARMDATITEMIFVQDAIEDGTYLLNLQIASFENDASPSKPILYRIENIYQS